MVAPRRQSTRPTMPTNLELEAEQDETMDDDFESDTSSESEEEGSDWDGKATRTTTGKAPAKRAKLTSSSSSRKPPQKLKRGQKTLGLLLDMPLDILFAILSLLSPKDLVNLTRTSKPLRKTLMTRNAVTVWKAAREILGIPDCPSDFSEPQWAVLLSGSNCQNCGTKSVFKVDFRLRRRVCTRCKKDNLVLTSKFPTVYPDLDPVILNFTPYTNVGGWAHGHASGSKFYWKADIEYVSREWERLQKNLKADVAGAKGKINEFKLARIDLVDEIDKYADVCEEWVNSVATDRLNETSSKKDKRYNAIVEKFKALGYIDEDIKTISRRNECTLSTELTDKIWKRIQPILEPLIQERKTSRLAAQRKELVRKRMVFLKTVYQLYLKTLVPSQWIYQPSVEVVAKFSVFNQVLNVDDDITISPGSFQEPVSLLPGLISTWIEERKTDLRNKIPSANTKQASGSGAAPTLDLFDLATSIFECASNCTANVSMWGLGYGNPLFGWDGVVPHRCKPEPWSYPITEIPTKISFSEKGSAAAAKLIALVRLDVSSATSADMDNKNPHFFCSECGPRSFIDKSYGRCVYTWRSGVAHHMSNPHKTEIEWRVLSAGEAAVVTKPEATDPIQSNACWTCNHCSIYLDSWSTRQQIIGHLKTIHNIANAKEPNDLFFLPNLRRSYLMVPVFKLSNLSRTPQDSIQNIICRHCDPSIKRLFKLSGVLAHLRDKHKVQNPTQGKDWVIYNMYRPTAI